MEQNESPPRLSLKPETDKAATVGDGKAQSSRLRRKGLRVLTLGCNQTGNTLGFRLTRSDE